MAPPPTSTTRGAKNSRAYRLRKKAQGRCQRCPNPATPGLTSCAECRDRNRKFQANLYGTIAQARRA